MWRRHLTILAEWCNNAAWVTMLRKESSVMYKLLERKYIQRMLSCWTNRRSPFPPQSQVPFTVDHSRHQTTALMTFHLPALNPLLLQRQPRFSPCAQTVLVVAMVKSVPSCIHPVQTGRQRSYWFLLEETEGLGAKNIETHDSYSQLCDVRAVRAACKTMLRFYASCRATTSSARWQKGIMFTDIWPLWAALLLFLK